MATVVTGTSGVQHVLMHGVSPAKVSPFGFKVAMLELPNTIDAADTATVVLADLGMTTLWYSTTFTHSTENSVVITEEATTSVTSGILSLANSGVTDNVKRAYLVIGI